MKNTHSITLLLLAAAAFGALQQSQATSATWNGTTDAVWATDTNWSATPAPGTGDTATFNNAGGAVDTIDLGAGVTIGNVLFDTASVAAYTIGANGAGNQTLTLNDSGAILATSTINATQTFNARLVLGTDATAQSYAITNNSTTKLLTFSGNITGGATGAAGAKILNVSAAAGQITLGGAITNGGANSLGLVFSAVSGSGQVNIGNAGNTYTGGTSVGTGVRLNVTLGNSLSSGAVTVAAGGQVFFNSLGTYANNFTISGNGTDALGAIRMGNGVTNTINGTVTLAANSSIGVDSSKNGVINGNITGGFGLTKVSAGNLALTGNNSYTGGTTVSAGNLTLTGTNTYNGSTTVQGGGKLIISGTGRIAPATGATLSLGSTGAGTLQYDSSATSKFGSVNLGGGTGAPGTLNQTAGTINATSLTLNNGFSGSAQGTVALSGGTLAISGATVVSNQVAGDNIYSTITVSGSGNLSIGGNLSMTAAPSAGRNAAGRVTQNGGTVTVTGILNMARTTAANTAPRRGEYDLSGGTLTVSQITQDAGSDTFGTFNFNGGKLTPTANSGTFMNGLTLANVYGGGAVIDTAGKDITIGQTLLATNDNGVATVSFTSGGTGYPATSTQALTFSAPTGLNPRTATGIASVNASGNVTSFSITDLGNGYTSAPTFTIAGGGSGASGTANLGLPTGITTTGGGLTKNGTGTLTLTGNNTYTGTTTVTVGTLVLSGTSASPTFSVANGATLTNSATSALTSALELTEGSNLTGAGNFTTSSVAVTADLGDGFTSINLGTTLTKNVVSSLNFSLSNVTPDGTVYSVFTGTAPAGFFSSVSVGGISLGTPVGNVFSAQVGEITYTYDDNLGVNTLSAIPEPGTWVLIGIGLTFLLYRKPRRFEA